MDFLIDTFLVGAGMMCAYFASIFFNKKVVISEPGVYPFQRHNSVTCPKCDFNWTFRLGHTYCECEVYHEGHFHIHCNGKDQDKRTCGCEFKWIMRTK